MPDTVSGPDGQELTVVYISFDPYSHSEFQTFLRGMHREFGPSGPHRGWQWTPVVDLITENTWTVAFHWREPRMAMLFALKYQRN